MKKEYVLAFSSFYKAAYAADKLTENKVRSTVRKLPPEIAKSCGYALYLVTASIQTVLDILEKNEITTKGVYLVQKEDGKTVYHQIA